MQRSRRALLQRRAAVEIAIRRKLLYKVSLSLGLVLWGLFFLLNLWISHGDSYRDGSGVVVRESIWQEIEAKPKKQSDDGDDLASEEIDPDTYNQDTTITISEATGSSSELLVNEENELNSLSPAKEQAVGSASTPLGVTTERETHKTDRLSRVAPPGLDEFKSKAINSKGRTIAGHTGTIIHKMEPGGTEHNYASATKGAKVLAFNKEAKGASNILGKDKDKYLRNPCSAEEKFVVIELSEETLVDTIEIANFEHYSSNLKDFELLSSLVYPTDNWVKLGNFTPVNVKHRQRFALQDPKWTRYLKLNLLSHYGSEFYCTLSIVEIYGVDAVERMLEDLISVQENGFLSEETHTQSTPMPVQLEPPPDGDYLYRKLLTEIEYDSEHPKSSIPDPVIEIRPPQSGRMPGDSVLKILMLKVQSLDLNFSVLERYLEELNMRYADIFQDLDNEMGEKELVLKQIKLQIEKLINDKQIFANDIGELFSWKSLVSMQLDKLIRDNAILRSEVERVQHVQVDMENKGLAAILLSFIFGCIAVMKLSMDALVSLCRVCNSDKFCRLSSAWLLLLLSSSIVIFILLL
ncbi:galactose-binding protein isoform X2 [Tasmannia lanceolata]|uniref:galactose-binding protein isoform X2 n=1 Tax=Tasmannia lanceolata TaxID=3420 RepID=UPI004063CBF2